MIITLAHVVDFPCLFPVYILYQFFISLCRLLTAVMSRNKTASGCLSHITNAPLMTW